MALRSGIWKADSCQPSSSQRRQFDGTVAMISITKRDILIRGICPDEFLPLR